MHHKTRHNNISSSRGSASAKGAAAGYDAKGNTSIYDVEDGDYRGSDGHQDPNQHVAVHGVAVPGGDSADASNDDDDEDDGDGHGHEHEDEDNVALMLMLFMLTKTRMMLLSLWLLLLNG